VLVGDVDKNGMLPSGRYTQCEKRLNHAQASFLVDFLIMPHSTTLQLITVKIRMNLLKV
jgi:hypothetical protein